VASCMHVLAAVVSNSCLPTWAMYHVANQTLLSASRGVMQKERRINRAEMNFKQGCLLSFRAYRYNCRTPPIEPETDAPISYQSAILHSPHTGIASSYSSCSPLTHVDLTCNLQVLPQIRPIVYNH
jgi:hypothetical protein